MGGGKGSSKAPAPDPNIGKAAMMEAQIAQDWLGFAKDQFQISNARQAEIDTLSKTLTEKQMAAQDLTTKWAQEDRARYEQVYKPMETKYAEQAAGWASPERQASEAAKAQADVYAQAAVQKAASGRQMAAMGIDPRSGRYAGINQTGDTLTALGAAGAANNARQQVQQQALAMQADAINMGKGLPSQAMQAYGLGLGAGGQALQTNLAANQNWLSNQNIMNSGFQGGMQGYGNQANILSQQYGQQLNAWNAQQQAGAQAQSGLMSGLGSVAGMGMMAF